MYRWSYLELLSTQSAKRCRSSIGRPNARCSRLAETMCGRTGRRRIWINQQCWWNDSQNTSAHSSETLEQLWKERTIYSVIFPRTPVAIYASAHESLWTFSLSPTWRRSLARCRSSIGHWINRWSQEELTGSQSWFRFWLRVLANVRIKCLEVWNISSQYRIRRHKFIHIHGDMDVLDPHHTFCVKTWAGADCTVEVHLPNYEWVWIREFLELNSSGCFLLRDTTVLTTLHKVPLSPAVATDGGSSRSW